ncbi:hypothetical cytosolic protein [Candidatus Vecturithrix granuli]|uniref:Hypothetical cytosolic protein n=1 Tax=Vecturithrix granuli TaxID=1499967 RepID=A0A081C9E8_VECG1|nr:hypothetical cytosolic protein [Candidatus Vecturithrix granuli]
MYRETEFRGYGQQFRLMYKEVEIMEQEKEKGFKVTDKRSVFQEERAETPEPEKTSASEAKSAEEPKQQHLHQENDYSPLFEANFLTLIFSLYTHAQISLGLVPDPISQQTVKELPQAKYNIDLLSILQEKTKGNLTQEEEHTLEQILFELRMMYVDASKTR